MEMHESHPVLTNKISIGEPTGIQYSKALKTQLASALLKKGQGYVPRTEHVHPNGMPLYTNRLILESSPYLIQHAHNPVNWYRWGEEAFEQAKQQDKPVFLSIGYSTCHWCHVMEKESFDNPEIAAILNQYFIAIKVDREQNPDVDSTYMMGVMMLTGRGGWPLSSFVTPEGNTFYGGTYFRPDDFSRLLLSISNSWKSRREVIVDQSIQLAGAVQKAMMTNKIAVDVGTQSLDAAWDRLNDQVDKEHGGFGGAPKFPGESSLLFLLERARSLQDDAALGTVLKALDGMAMGGIYDQVGGGFHRYATDARWQIPHFEKMLYNQALLGRVYLQAYQLTFQNRYRRVVEQTLDYVLREMTDKNGGFYSATDADSEGEEGVFFIWSEAELQSALTPKEAKLAISLFGVTSRGNFEGHNIFHLPQSLEQYAKKHTVDIVSLYQQVDQIREKLRHIRSARIAPIRDDKIILAWNAMMITAFAEAGYLLDRTDYLQAAEKAAEFLWHHSRLEGGRLARIYFEGSSSIDATQEDYAYFAEAMIKLYDTSHNLLWLERAQKTVDKMLSLFWDPDSGGLFMNTRTSVPIMSRAKDAMDNAMPSGNSVALGVLVKLSRRSENNVYQQKARELIEAFSADLVRIPEAFTYMMIGVSELNSKESGLIQYAANGHVRAAISPMHANKPGDENKLFLSLSIDDGWHINAEKPLQDYLIPTSISIEDTSPNNNGDWVLNQVEYPPAKKQVLGFSEQVMALYQGQQTLTLNLSKTSSEKGNKWLPIKLQLQACNDKMCLAPETLHFNLRR